MEKITRENITKHMFEYELSVVGKTIMDVVNDDKWRFNFTITMEQHAEFKKYCIKLIKKTFKCNSAKAQETYTFFYSNLGLRIKN
jgi:hypothetical protein